MKTNNKSTKNTPRWTKVKASNKDYHHRHHQQLHNYANDGANDDDIRSKNSTTVVLPPGMSPLPPPPKKNHAHQKNRQKEQQQQQQKQKQKYVNGSRRSGSSSNTNSAIAVSDDDDNGAVLSLTRRVMEESLLDANISTTSCNDNDNDDDDADKDADAEQLDRLRYKRLRKMRKKLSEAQALYTKAADGIVVEDEQQRTKMEHIPAYQAEITQLEEEIAQEQKIQHDKDVYRQEQRQHDHQVRIEEWQSFSAGHIVQGYMADAEQEEFSCPLCAGPFETAVITSQCGHVFCRSCLEESVAVAAVRSQGDPSSIVCPMCRTCLLVFDPTTPATNHETNNNSMNSGSNHSNSTHRRKETTTLHTMVTVQVEAATKIRRKMKKKRCVCRCGTELSLASLRQHLRTCREGAPTLFEHEIERGRGTTNHEAFKQPYLDPTKVRHWKQRIQHQQTNSRYNSNSNNHNNDTTTRGQYYSGSNAITIPEGYDEEAEIQAAILQSLRM